MGGMLSSSCFPLSLISLKNYPGVLQKSIVIDLKAPLQWSKCTVDIHLQQHGKKYFLKVALCCKDITFPWHFQNTRFYNNHFHIALLQKMTADEWPNCCLFYALSCFLNFFLKHVVYKKTCNLDFECFPHTTHGILIGGGMVNTKNLSFSSHDLTKMTRRKLNNWIGWSQEVNSEAAYQISAERAFHRMEMATLNVWPIVETSKASETRETTNSTRQPSWEIRVQVVIKISWT